MGAQSQGPGKPGCFQKYLQHIWPGMRTMPCAARPRLMCVWVSRTHSQGAPGGRGSSACLSPQRTSLQAELRAESSARLLLHVRGPRSKPPADIGRLGPAVLDRASHGSITAKFSTDGPSGSGCGWPWVCGGVRESERPLRAARPFIIRGDPLHRPLSHSGTCAVAGRAPSVGQWPVEMAAGP